MEEKLDRIIELLEEINSKIGNKDNETNKSYILKWLEYCQDVDAYLAKHGKPPKEND